MGSCRRVCTAVCLGFAVGAAVVLALDPKTREKLWKEVVDKTETLKKQFRDYEQRLNEVLEAGKREAEIKQKQQQGQTSLEEESKESPNYIV